MSFNSNKFAASRWTPRTAVIETPELAPWFDKGDTPQVIVRGLTGEELARANEAASQATSGRLEAVVAALAGGNDEVMTAVKEILGTSGRAPADHVRRLELLQIGCVEPRFDLRGAHALALNLPTTFLTLTNKIVELTGLGSEPGKPKGSGATGESGPQ